MKKLLFIAGTFLIAISGHCAEEWKLVWSDEFNYQGLPDKTKWDYEEGFVRNHESQYYTRARTENARVEHGVLILECRKEHFTPEKHAPVEYTAASVITKNKASWQYGRIEVRAKLPRGKGVWPAIWTLGANIPRAHWPACGEIDIMEFLGRMPDTIHGTVHFASEGKHKSDGGRLKTVKPFDDFHIFAVEWFPDRIEFFFDTVKYHTMEIDKAGRGDKNPFRLPHYLLINFALGGGWGRAIDDSILPQRFVIDYVRVYQRSGGEQAASVTDPEHR